jgi:protein ImuB
MLWVGVHLPALSLESFLETLAPRAPAHGEEGGSGGDAFGPVALIARHRLVAVNPAAWDCGLRPGHKRATALAIAPHARLGEPDPRRDAAAMEAAVHALMAFTPAVCLAEGYVALAEVQASLRCFGGPARLLARLRAALAGLGHAVRVACAPTAQAAQWFAVWRDDADAEPPPAAQAGWRDRIGALPVELMAAAAPHLPTLHALGLATAADLWRQPRAGLVRRFGAPLLADIDRATGELADPRAALEPPRVFDSRLELFMRADDCAALLVPACVLLQRLSAWAQACHGRVGGFELRLHHETHRRLREDPGAGTTKIAIGLGEPVADAAHLQALVRERLQRQPLAASVIELSLHCDAIVPGAPPNAELFPSAASADEGWQRLLERFEARLGARNLQRLRRVADHCPERATAVAIGSAPPARPAGGAEGEPLALAPAQPRGADLALAPERWPRQRRPVWRVDPPLPLRERAGIPLLGGRPLCLVAGPERIEADWWESLVARDYFIAQADDGALVWIFRARDPSASGQGGWHLQGRFG